MDAQELPQINSAVGRREVAAKDPAHCSTPAALATDCTAATCHWRCALEVIDELLSQPRTAVTGEESDLLLDLRWHLRQRSAGEAALRIFCDLRRRMEARHYLAFFRIRRWLEKHLVASVRRCPAAAVHEVPVKLDHYCVEAIRRVCLCAGLSRGSILLAPRLQFAFRCMAPASNGVAVGLK